MCLAIPGKILEVSPEGQSTALVDVAGVRRKVDLTLLQDEEARPGDCVLIHVGFALSKISEADAVEQMQMLMMLGEDKVAMEEVRGYGLGQKNPEDSSQESEDRSQEPVVRMRWDDLGH